MSEKTTLTEFRKLSDQQQESRIFSHGQLVDSVITTQQLTTLYQVYDFYVELNYNMVVNKLTGKKFYNREEVIEYWDLS